MPDQNAAKLEALRHASQAGWRDLEAGRYRDPPTDELADYVAQLGKMAAGSERG